VAATGGGAAGEAPATEPSTQGFAPAAPTTAAIGMPGRAFGPSAVTIAAVGTVEWRNDDDREHTVTATVRHRRRERLGPRPGRSRRVNRVHPIACPGRMER
jgi:plastocyanin